jgi:hypothetical protein
MAKYGKIWQISKIILNHFVRCRLSPLECCVSQGLFDYSTYKSLMARCRRAHFTRQSVHNPYLISDLNLISIWSHWFASAKAVPRQCQGAWNARWKQGMHRMLVGYKPPWTRKALARLFQGVTKTLCSLSYLVISCHILSYEVEWQGSLKKTGPGNPMPNLVPDLGMRERFLAPSKQKPALKRTFGLFEQFEQFWTVWMVWTCLNLWKSKDKTGRSRWHSNAESSRQSNHEPQSSARS